MTPEIKKIKIVIAEDDLAMREIITHKLGASGFDVHAASDGKQAWEMIQAERPAIVMLDLMMPEMDGLQVLEVMRGAKDKLLSTMPVIVLSNLWSNEDILKVKALGVDTYLVKAYFTPDEILGKIKEVLKM